MREKYLLNLIRLKSKKIKLVSRSMLELDAALTALDGHGHSKEERRGAARRGALLDIVRVLFVLLVVVVIMPVIMATMVQVEESTTASDNHTSCICTYYVRLL